MSLWHSSVQILLSLKPLLQPFALVLLAKECLQTFINAESMHMDRTYPYRVKLLLLCQLVQFGLCRGIAHLCIQFCKCLRPILIYLCRACLRSDLGTNFVWSLLLLASEVYSAVERLLNVCMDDLLRNNRHYNVQCCLLMDTKPNTILACNVTQSLVMRSHDICWKMKASISCELMSLMSTITTCRWLVRGHVSVLHACKTFAATQSGINISCTYNLVLYQVGLTWWLVTIHAIVSDDGKTSAIT